ncbi:hypothetical protein Ahy_B01g054972 isoform D [Arachis hypogaea]|uniref:Peptidase S9 prolyl oligopeptidase catalytic domain-containing protein n=1 Tax=Arachis hypogaea TaxID=3818 RepID=A0A445AUM9_ARAHY|nr:hypothetical protein Ahy_B01g054972 isoform D [Arachis hypogaea]
MVDMYVEIETSAYISEILGKDMVQRNSVMVIRFDIVLRKVVLHSSLLYFLKPGGGVVLLYASKYDDVKLVVNISGRYDLKAGVEERLGKDYMERIKKDGFIDVKNKSVNFNYRVTEESLMDRFGTNMHEACLNIDKDCRVLTVHGSSDTVIPVQDALEFAKIIPIHKLHIIEGADHPYTKHQDELTSVVVNFIKENLHQDGVIPKEYLNLMVQWEVVAVPTILEHSNCPMSNVLTSTTI